MADLVADFATLFVGREDGYGLVTGVNIKERVTPAIWTSHLYHKGHSLGIYPMGNNGMTHWGCTDIDFGYDESWPLALNLQAALGVLDILSWVEITKGKGFHVWVFLHRDEWIHASYMRKALLVAHQLAGVPPKEVNPKNPDPTAVVWGSYVNLPYAHDWWPLGKRVVLDAEGEPMTVEQFVEAASDSTNSPQSLVAAASLYVEPPPEVAVALSPYDGELRDITKKLSPIAWTVFTKGPLEGRDRSSTMVRLMHYCKEDGIPPSEAMALLDDFDSRFGKFVGRPDREKELTKMIQRAYGCSG